jgi:transposase
LLRVNLVMCALSAILKNKQLEEFYLRIKQKGGYRKAIVATANRLVKIIYFTLRYNWYFTDFGNQKREILPINWE